MRSSYVKLGSPCTPDDAVTVRKRLNFIYKYVEIKDKVILDIGTGFGTYLYQLCDEAKFCIGIDVNEENLNKAKKLKRANIEFIKMSATDLRFEDNTFDVVLMIEVLEHIDNDKKAISEAFRVLKPGGKLIITVPNKLFPFETHGFRIGSKSYGTRGLGFPFLPYLPEKVRKHVANARVYTPWGLKKMLTEAGFSVNNVEFLSPSMDNLKKNFHKLSAFIEFSQGLLDIIEHIPLLNLCLSSTIIICAEKVNIER